MLLDPVPLAVVDPSSLDVDCLSRLASPLYLLVKERGLILYSSGSIHFIVWPFSNHLPVKQNLIQTRNLYRRASRLFHIGFDHQISPALTEPMRYRRDRRYYFEYPLEMTVEIKARTLSSLKTTSKRTRESFFSAAPDSPSNSPQHKRERASRTTQARDYNEAKTEMYQRLKEAGQKIMERWQCTLPNCRNHPKFCLVRGLDHYPLLTPDIWHWARQRGY
jgi:hypothetical protein